MASHAASAAPAVRSGTRHGRTNVARQSVQAISDSPLSLPSKPGSAGNNIFPIVVVTAGAIMMYSAIANVGISTIIRDLISGKDPRQDAGSGTAGIAIPSGFAAVPGTTSKLPDGTTVTEVGPGGKPVPIKVPTGAFKNPPSPGPAIAGNIPKSFSTLVLKAIGAPLTQANYNFLSAWSGHESTAAKNNYLASTTSAKGATPFNTFGAGGKEHVWNYPTEVVGALATARSLMGGLYGDLLSALRSGKPSLTAHYAGLSKWSGGAYSSVAG